MDTYLCFNQNFKKIVVFSQTPLNGNSLSWNISRTRKKLVLTEIVKVFHHYILDIGVL